MAAMKVTAIEMVESDNVDFVWLLLFSLERHTSNCVFGWNIVGSFGAFF